MYAEGAARLRALMDALPELIDAAPPPGEAEGEQQGEEGGGGGGVSVLAQLLDSTPALVEAEPAVVRGALESLAAALRVSLVQAARLAARVPAVWEREPDASGAKLRHLAAELGVGAGAALELICAQPGIWEVNQPSIIKDRLDTIAIRLGLPLPAFVSLVGRQALLWVVQPTQVASTLADVAGRLGLSGGEAAELLVRCPPLLALEPKLLRLSVQGVSASTGVPVPVLLRLLSRSLGLVAVPTELLAAALEGLAGDLGVSPTDVAELMTSQPTLLCAQYVSIKAGLETLESALGLPRPAALRLLAAQPGLMFDTSADTLAGRLDGLAATFRLPSHEAARELAQQVPALLTVAPATVRSAAAALAAGAGCGAAEVVELARNDPGEFVLVSMQPSVLDAWSARLELSGDAVRQLLSAQPGLLELTPTTLKARLESLAALFGVPAGLAGQLVLKHAALAAVPPNATITRAKNISTALQVSMQTAAGFIAKEPAFLAVLAACSAELAGSPVPDEVGQVGAAYEFFTVDWLQRQLREMQGGRMTSFASLDR